MTACFVNIESHGLQFLSQFVWLFSHKCSDTGSHPQNVTSCKCMNVWGGKREREKASKTGRDRRRLMDYWMLSLFEDGGETPMSFESDMGLTTPSIRFLLQSPMLLSEDSLGQVTLPVRSIRSSRAHVLLMLLSWISLTGENSGIDISSSFEAGLKNSNNNKQQLLVIATFPSNITELPDDSPDLHGLHLIARPLHI